MKLLTTDSTPAEFVEAVNALTIRAADPLEPYHRLLSWLETAPLRALVVCDTPLPSPKGALLGRWRPLHWSMSLGFGQIFVCASATDPVSLQGGRLDYVLFLTTPTPALLAAIEERLLGAGDPVVEWAPGVERPSVATTELDTTIIRTVRIRQHDGTWRAAPYNDLRAGMVFELFEPDGTPANGGGWWLALSNVADDVVGTIRCEPAPEMSPEWAGEAVEDKPTRVTGNWAAMLNQQLKDAPRAGLIVVARDQDPGKLRALFPDVPKELWVVHKGIWTSALPNGSTIHILQVPIYPYQLEGAAYDIAIVLAPLPPDTLDAIRGRLAGSEVGRFHAPIASPSAAIRELYSGVFGGAELPADVRALYGDAFASARRDADPNRWTIWYLTSAGNVASWTVGDDALRTVPDDLLVRTSEGAAACADVALRGLAPTADAMVGESHPLFARTTCWRDGVQVPYRAVNLATGVSVLNGVETWVDTVRIDDSVGPPARQFLPHPLPAFVHVQGLAP